MVAGTTKRAAAKALRTARRSLDRFRGRKRVHMLHIGKTGGTALKTALAKASTPRVRFIVHKHGVSLSDIPVGEPCFFVVRDPVTRFVSGFLSRQRQGRPRYDFPWTPAEQEAFAAFATPNELALALSGPDAARRREAEAAMAGIHHVGDHYSRWFGDQAHLRQRRSDILLVGSQERLDQDVARLSALLVVTIVLPRDEAGSHRNPAHADRDLDPESVANLKAWYRDDYALLRLLREWFPQLPDYDAGTTA